MRLGDEPLGIGFTALKPDILPLHMGLQHFMGIGDQVSGNPVAPAQRLLPVLEIRLSLDPQ